MPSAQYDINQVVLQYQVWKSLLKEIWVCMLSRIVFSILIESLTSTLSLDLLASKALKDSCFAEIMTD